MLRAFSTCAAVLTATAVHAQPPSETRQRQLVHLLEHDCGSCHGLTMKGGLGPPLVPVVIAEKPEEALIDAILNGRPGTPMPPWAFALSEAEAAWLVDRLRRGTTE